MWAQVDGVELSGLDRPAISPPTVTLSENGQASAQSLSWISMDSKIQEKLQLAIIAVSVAETTCLALYPGAEISLRCCTGCLAFVLSSDSRRFG